MVRAYLKLNVQMIEGFERVRVRLVSVLLPVLAKPDEGLCPALEMFCRQEHLPIHYGLVALSSAAIQGLEQIKGESQHV